MSKVILYIVSVVLSATLTTPLNADERTIPLLEGEKFWGGCVTDGRAMPFGEEAFERDLFGDTRGNQAQPLLISDKGRYVWCEEPFVFIFDDGNLFIRSEAGAIMFGRAGDSLREAYQHVSRTYFPSTGESPDETLFVKPQYNTSIELIYDQREDRIRQYADDILANGFPAGVLMIDDNWQEDYGVWEFHPGRFQNPKGMMDRLHSQGFKVMLWICPYFSPDCETYRLMNKQGYFLKDKRGGTHITKWWNGYSASLDLTNPEAVKYFQGRLQYLVDEYGVDGFKLDAGDARSYRDPNIKSLEPISPNAFSERWAALGLPFKLNEYRACWKLAGQPLAQRLRDKGHNSTPPMGWNSFDSYGVYLHEEAALANIDAMAEKLKPHGYEYVVVDNGWFGEYALQEGTIFPAEKHACDTRKRNSSCRNRLWLPPQTAFVR